MWFNRYSSLNFKVHFFKVNIQLHIEYSRIKFCRAFHQQLKCFNDEYQVPIAHSVFKQSVHSCSNLRSKSVAKKMIQLSYYYTREANHSIL